MHLIQFFDDKGNRAVGVTRNGQTSRVNGVGTVYELVQAALKSGAGLAAAIDAWSQGWFHAKLALVIALSGYHGWMAGYARKLARGERPLEGRKLRLLNEVPGIAAALIVVLVIVRPF